MQQKKDQGVHAMIEIGRVVIKTAGRDAGLRGIVIDIVDKEHVLLAGQVRRRKCNTTHIEPLSEKVKIEKNAGDDEVIKVLKKIGIEVKVKKKKETAEKPKKVKKKEKIPQTKKKSAKKK